MKHIKIDPKIIARRGINSISSKILDELYQRYPDSLEASQLAKNLNLREKSVLSAIRKIINDGVPIEKTVDSRKKIFYKANLHEPISWIIKERNSAKQMLSLIGNGSLSKSGNRNVKKTINNRIYIEYIDSLNELFDKWTSLKLIEKLEKKD